MRGNEYNLQQGSYNSYKEKVLHDGSGCRETVVFRDSDNLP